MGVGRRMKKQGPPPSLEEFNASRKRKAGEPETEKSSGNKRRRAGDTKTAAQTSRPNSKGKTKKLLLRNADAQTVPIPTAAPRAGGTAPITKEAWTELGKNDTDLDIEHEQGRLSDM